MNGNDLIEMGFKAGKWFGEALKIANSLEKGGISYEQIKKTLEDIQPKEPVFIPARKIEDVSYTMNIDVETEDEKNNFDSVKATMNELMKTPVISRGSIMPDACPAGPLGVIPVGGVIESSEIHPGAHSADICCSMALSNFGQVHPEAILNAGLKYSHFGPGGRSDLNDMPSARSQIKLLDEISENRFLSEFIEIAKTHMGTQGDGNHFYYVGTLKSTGDTCLVTHHGSRGFGAKLYKKAMKLADKYRLQLSPETIKQNSWIPADSDDGRDYWAALQLIRQWTKENHYTIHDLVRYELNLELQDRFWNEHNFVFKRGDKFLHGKGATPGWNDFASDTDGRTLIPLNMAEPILITAGSDNDNGLGFLPHGAGRNFSRTEFGRRHFKKTRKELIERETEGIVAHSWSGKTDISELPGAYKNAFNVKSQILKFGLGEVTDEILPYGNIMAGEIPRRKK